MAETLVLGQYHYWDEHEEDNIKRFHFFEDNTGTDHHIDFSPYYNPTEEELDAVRTFVDSTGRLPTREDNNGANFHKGDIKKLLRDVCICGVLRCDDEYSHWSGGY